ncbi:hypothetical protein [Salinispora oceanensis]|uniref:hypothetical protein n=1 Tax=Salinispora oceanensis TaxID=1050199 RepID=UPI0009B7DEB5|nr:hypothetical protein [Salinispora oceanensis]
MAASSKLSSVVRWLLRRQELPPRTRIGEHHQAIEQEAARRRLLDQARRLRDTQWHREPTQPAPPTPTMMEQRTDGETRGHR